MKTRCSKLVRLASVLIAGLALMLAGPVTAQTFTVLHSFTELSRSTYPEGTNSDGAIPHAGLILSGNTLYGTASEGGSSGYGTVFAVNTDGTGFTNLHNFTGGDGAYPEAGLILSGNTLYGTAAYGGHAGTVFAVNTDGTGFTNLYSSIWGVPHLGGLILWGNTLYWTTSIGPTDVSVDRYGYVSVVNTDGTGFTNLLELYGWLSGLVLSGNTLYGTDDSGLHLGGSGTVFAVNTDGTGFTNLYSFAGLICNPPYYFPCTNSDGAYPEAALFLSGNTLFGTASEGGSWGWGTLFAVNTDGTGFTNLHTFTRGGDGGGPEAGLILSGNTLYGTAISGGSSGYGTVFAVNTDGTGFTTLHSFTGGSDADSPYAGLILSGNTLYGTASGETSGGSGTVFSLSFVPQLTIIRSAANVVLSWPTNYAGFDYTGYTLQSTTNLGSSAVWTTNSPAPVVVNGQNTVTNPISGTQQFFRLSR